MILWVLRLLTTRGICKQWLHVSSHTEQSTGGWPWSSALTTPMVCKGSRDTILERTPVLLLLRSVARKLLMSSVSRSTKVRHPALCFLPFSFPGATICRTVGLLLSVSCELQFDNAQHWWLHCEAVTPPCYPSSWKGIALRVAVVFQDTKESALCSSKLLAPQAGASHSGESCWLSRRDQHLHFLGRGEH